MILPVITIVMIMLLLGGVMWVCQAYRMLRMARFHLMDSWTELKAALNDRREMIPYIVAAMPVNISPILDVLGNACDLAANVEGVQECSRAEARLSAVMSKLFAQLDTEAPIETLEILSPLRDRLKDQEMRVTLLKEAYNRQADLFNALQLGGAARMLVSLGLVLPVEKF